MRVEHIGTATLYQADCRDLLPGMNVDHIISDPPYEDAVHSAISKGHPRYDSVRPVADLPFTSIDAIREEVARKCVMASHGWVLLFCTANGVGRWTDAIERHGGKPDTVMVWIKPDGMPRLNGSGPAPGFECIVSAWCGSGDRSWNGGGRRGVFTHNVHNGEKRQHPTAKPESLMSELVTLFSNRGDTICDPFMGSGTTGVSCALNGRKFVGIENHPPYFDAACKRIEKAQACMGNILISEDRRGGFIF